MDSIKSQNIFKTARGYAQPSNEYEHFFNYLRQSPSYKLALADLGLYKLPASARLAPPQDFKTVLRTASAARDIHAIGFEQWWELHGIVMFGERGQKPMPRIVKEVGREAVGPWLGLEAAIEPLYKPRSRNDGMIFYVEIPEEATRVEMMNLFDQIQARTKSMPPIDRRGKFHLSVNKINRRTLELGHLALDLYQTTDMELWRIGAKIGMSETHKELLDYKAPKVRNDDSDEKRSMTAMVGRLLKKAKHLSENAARGVFPSAAEPAYCAEFLRPSDKTS